MRVGVFVCVRVYFSAFLSVGVFVCAYMCDGFSAYICVDRTRSPSLSLGHSHRFLRMHINFKKRKQYKNNERRKNTVSLFVQFFATFDVVAAAVAAIAANNHQYLQKQLNDSTIKKNS